MTALWLQFLCLGDVRPAAFLEEIDRAFPIARIDRNDPVRRKVARGEVGRVADQLLGTWGENETSFWLFGSGVNVSLMFWLQRPEGPSSDATVELLEKGWRGRLDAVRALFETGVRLLSPFYALVDLVPIIAAKKHDEGGSDLQKELPGVFWLTYFGPHYTQRLPLDQLPAGSVSVVDSGSIVQLAETPDGCTPQTRRDAEAALGAATFRDPTTFRFKRRGEFALTFDQLRRRPT